MRALKMLGLAEDGANLVCEEPASGELFAVPVDERLLAALGVDVSRPAPHRPAIARLEEQDTEMEPQLRPREIQSRIRGGETLEQVAEAAGCEPSRIERFAYPVLMERSSTADRGKLARPVIDGSPARSSVEKLVRETLAARGQAGSILWDAYRTEAGSWVLKLTWNAGRSENTARWTYHQSAGGGTLTPLDDAATQIVDPAPRPLRTVPEAVVEDEPVAPLNPLATQHMPEVADPVIPHEPLIPSPAQVTTTPVKAAAPKPGTNKVAAALAHHAVSSPTASAAESERVDTAVARTGTEDPGRRDQRAPMPSWEDVLLGVRSPGG